jgi:multidrug efflux pump subunit AcrA (membrane-fusion protein)
LGFVNTLRRTIGPLLSTVIVLVPVLLSVGCARGSTLEVPGTESNQIVTAFLGDLSSSISASGEVLAQQRVELSWALSGRIDHVLVDAGDQVQAGDVLARLEADQLERSVRAAEQALKIQEANLAALQRPPGELEVAAAQAAVASAKAQLDDLLAGPSQEDLAQAQAALASAVARLDDLVAGPTKEELSEAESAVASALTLARAAEKRYSVAEGQLVGAQNDIDNARNAVERARWAYDALVLNDWKVKVSWGPYSPQAAALKQAEIDAQVAVARYNLAKVDVNDSEVLSAQAQLAQAQANLAALTREKTVDIAAARAQVAQTKASVAALTKERTVEIAAARAQLAQAEARLSSLMRGADEEKTAIARAQVERARISLSKARRNLDRATLAAPFDGLVTEVFCREGEWASGIAVELANLSSVEVVLDLDEVDLGAIAVGQPALVTLEPWPDQQLTGEVTFISPRASDKGGIVIYEVHVSLPASDLSARPGMTANAEVTTAALRGILLVPNRAIVSDRQAGRYYVNRIEGNAQQRVEVSIGLRDSSYTQITDGLEPGDPVSIAQAQQSWGAMERPPSGMRDLMR